MNQTERIVSEWSAARSVIAGVLRRHSNAEAEAEAIIAALAAHYPPILLSMEHSDADTDEPTKVRYGLLASRLIDTGRELVRYVNRYVVDMDRIGAHTEAENARNQCGAFESAVLAWEARDDQTGEPA